MNVRFREQGRRIVRVERSRPNDLLRPLLDLWPRQQAPPVTAAQGQLQLIRRRLWSFQWEQLQLSEIPRHHYPARLWIFLGRRPRPDQQRETTADAHLFVSYHSQCLFGRPQDIARRDRDHAQHHVSCHQEASAALTARLG
jgi:hypothetical protein